MDYHLKFRFDSMQPPTSGIGQPGKSRLPASSAPMLFRSKCKPVPLGADPGNSESQAPSAGTTPECASAPKVAKNPAEVQKQVKQLQFWLKVFSRFCQDSK